MLRCIQPGFHTSHSGLLVQSQPYATTGLGRGDSTLPQTHGMRERRDGVWGEEIWVSEEEFRVGKACDSFIYETAARC